MMSCYSISSHCIYLALYNLSFTWYSTLYFMDYNIAMFVNIEDIIICNCTMIRLLPTTSRIKGGFIKHDEFTVYTFQDFGFKLMWIFFIIKQVSVWDAI